MDTQTLDSFRRKLIRRGQSLIEGEYPSGPEEREIPRVSRSESAGSAADQALSERRAQVREAEAVALLRIQASLARIAQGTFGDCVVCHAPIETERLRAIPEVDRCGGCTH